MKNKKKKINFNFLMIRIKKFIKNTLNGKNNL